MKAAIYTQYGGPSVLKLVDMAKPSPKDNELLVKICASSVTVADTRVRASRFPLYFWLLARLIFGLFRPKKKILGHEFSGTVEAVGSGVKKFKKGDQVFGTTTLLKVGGYAEYACIPEQWKHGVVAKAPQQIALQQAAALPIGAMTALFLLKKAGIKSGQKVLIYGASGSVGSYALQIAKHFGAKVFGVCGPTNMDWVHELGAEKVLDYTLEDFSQLNDEFDIVFDAVGKTTKRKAKKVLSKEGKFVSINMFTSEKTEALLEVCQMVDEEVLKPVIDKTYPLDQIVVAHEYVDLGHKKGNVLVVIET